MMFAPADAWLLAGTLVLFVLAGYFSAAQTALSRMSLARAQKLADEDRPGAARLVLLMQDPVATQNILALLLVVIQVTGVAMLAVVAHRIMLDAPAVVATAVVASTVLYVAAEVAPKTIALQRTDHVACAVARIVGLLAKPLSPVARALIAAGNALAPGKGLPTGPFVTEEQLRDMIDVAESDEVIEESERAMIHSIFELGDTVVREIMVPRPDMVTVHEQDALRDVLEVILSAGFSRIPVYRDDRDSIAGLVYAKDVLRRLHLGGGEDEPWQDLLRPAYFVPELKSADALLGELRAEKIHLAIVVDEYGAIAGLITIEDILEEIVGEIVDEYDREERLIEPLGDDRWRVDARVPVDDLAELVQHELPCEEWDTVGGLLFGMLGHVATPGETVAVDGVSLTAERVKGRRIAKVLVERDVHATTPPTVMHS